MSLFVQLDAGWPDNLKIMRVGLEGAGLHAIAMCLAKRMETDGVIHRAHLLRYGATDDLIDTLIHEELLDPVSYGSRPGEDADVVYSFRVHDWHDRNPSQDAIAATRNAKKRAAQEGNHKRWKHEGAFNECDICNPKKPSVLASDRNSVAGAIADAKRVRSPYTESETETKEESQALFDEFWDLYPLKVGKAKALKSWTRLSEDDQTEALSVLPKHIRSWDDREKRYIPHPTTWLNGRRWEDEVAEPRRNGPRFVNGIWVEPGVDL